MQGFELDPRLARDTLPVTVLNLSEVRLMNDRRFPWAILVPRRPGITEIFELRPLDQVLLSFETLSLADGMKRVFGAKKMNIAALGNMVPMLHTHVIARFDTDAAWPAPVWGVGTAEPYSPEEAARMTDLIRNAALPS
ncbi:MULTISPECIES: HIT domain-containing protein [unclassified Aureimonas]|uniref:HIT domain-containing protein n=1 Tax=unclassified Aureimonas TaxID=2615206 RepID=UPI0006FA3FF4|nr:MULTISPECIES: HIT family protein [unclassified Aureimonas]KQT53877.1 hypothetical protein ASG62_11630 [Aureimonas sp. Leaf427]KQT71681.1 hypothetical protein ASG54_19530 [Aureimonas sp. Leaf460]